MIFDSHAHYDDEAFDNDRDEVIASIKEQGIVGVLNCGSSMEGAIKSLELSKKYDFFYSALGIHPEYADKIIDNDLDKIVDLCKYEKVKAIGEIGLDYYYEENPSRKIQKQTFINQMEIAKKLDLPVVLHIREAFSDSLEIIKMFPEVHGVVHCFSGSEEFAKECIKRGYYIGFTGVVTFKNAKKVLDVAKYVPLDRMLVETDCPYMAPVPFRGKRNYSPYIKYIIEKLSEVKGINSKEMEYITISNSKNLLNILK
ncbi:MAG: TatD family hydrolase [Clostridiaceae bacterium]